MEASIEKPADGLNGECIVLFSGKYSDYKMKVKLVNGKRNGGALIVNDGVPYLNFEYTNGVMTGYVERLNKYGLIDLKGHVINGVESGLFVEYDNSKKVVWRGYYRNGARYSEVVKSEKMKGYYDERSVATGSLLSIAQYNKKLGDKNGRCFEFENSALKRECVYESGMKKHTVREFMNGKMILFDLTGKKVYEGVYYGDMKSGYFCHERMEGMAGFFKEVDSTNQLISVSQYDESNIHRNGKCFELENGELKRVCFYESDQLVRVMMEFNGSTMIEYNSGGKKVYKGEFKGDMKSGFMRSGDGKEYDKDGEIATYSGQWTNGKRNGLGTMYRRGRSIYSGKWMKGLPSILLFVIVGFIVLLFAIIVVVVSVIGANKYNNIRIRDCNELSGFSRFHSNSAKTLSFKKDCACSKIVIGNSYFGKVRLLELDGLDELESIVIGENSFRVGYGERSDGACRIVNCPKLKSIQIGSWSFSDYYSFELNNLPSLQSIDIGVRCYYWAPSFSLTGLIDWLV